MKKPDEKKANARRKQLEAEVELLEGEIAEAVHWQRSNDIRSSLARVIRFARDLGREFGIDDLE
jgi:glutamyl-tRNA reductase